MKALFKVMLWSLIVGLALAWTGLSPAQAIRTVWAWIIGVVPIMVTALGWAWPYVAEGAILVVPLVAISTLIRHRRRRRQDREGPPDD